MDYTDVPGFTRDSGYESDKPLEGTPQMENIDVPGIYDSGYGSHRSSEETPQYYELQHYEPQQYELQQYELQQYELQQYELQQYELEHYELEQCELEQCEPLGFTTLSTYPEYTSFDEATSAPFQMENTDVLGSHEDSGYGSHKPLEGTSRISPGEKWTHSTQGTDQGAATVYSDTSSLATSLRENHILEITDDLFDKVNELNPDFNTWKRISAMLPDLLMNFALLVGHNAETDTHRQFMVYVYKYRRKITETFTEMYSEMYSDQPDSPETEPFNTEEMRLDDEMDLWFEKGICKVTPMEDWDLDDPPSRRTLDSGICIETEEPLEDKKERHSTRMLLAYQNSISSTVAYQWLVSRLENECRLMPNEPNTIWAIRQKILSSLPPVPKVSRRFELEGHQVQFNLDWDPLAFFAHQKYEIEPADTIEGVITITGGCQDAQALTSVEYIRQTWPVTGKSTLQCVKQLLYLEPGTLHCCTLSDGTRLDAWVNGTKFVASVSGAASSIADIGEQLAWLGAAFRSSPRHKGPVLCTPTITKTCIEDLISSTETIISPTKLVYKIGFTIEEAQDFSQYSNGQCWHGLFRNPVVVAGYPILRRKKINTGLEVHLSMLAKLARTNRIDQFKENVFLKGFSTLLMPTMRDGSLLFWHLIYNEDGNRISYLDSTSTFESSTIPADFENYRHILGWCSEAHFYGGSAKATYNIGHTGLPRAQGDCASSNVRVSAGRLLTGGPSFHIGLKDTPTHVTRSGYIARLKWISTKLVLLWDETDKRGWLVNGVSALLHIVRASLAHDSKDKFRSAFVFKNESFQESTVLFTVDSAAAVLINPDNMKLPLYPEKEGYITLESRVDHFYNIVEKLIDHQADTSGYCGINMAEKPRQNLEGWDFADLTTNRDPLHPRVATIEPKGKGWVDFTRAAHAVTLFGRGFGEIIQPVGTGTCERWLRLPTQMFYIAICIADLNHALRENDYYSDTHVRLSENIIWHTPTTLFMSCRCQPSYEICHCEPVQTLIPLHLINILPPRKLPIPQESLGAVIFGHNSTFRWTWDDTGHPHEMEPAALSDIPDADSSVDSGYSTNASLSRASESLSCASSQNTTHSSENLHLNATLSDFPASPNKEYRSRKEYTVGILCALPKELKAVRALFDQKHDNVDIPNDDSNHYSLGKICDHMVVAACLPAGEIGTNSAAHSISNMNRSFPSLRHGFCLLVGIGGGAPSKDNDIRLGDVVVSLPTGTQPGVLQYDRGKEKENTSFELTGSLAPPPRYLTSAISALRSDPDLPPDPLRHYLERIASSLPEYRYPGKDRDQLFKTSCSRCQAMEPCPSREDHIRNRTPRPTDQPYIHYGLIASGNRVLKDSRVRDSLAREHGVLCFEMEAAGVVNAGLGCLVIRGISDYADASKNKEWQEYAAASAAAYAKLLLGVVVRRNKPKDEDLRSLTR